jgi:hypothetical protein
MTTVVRSGIGFTDGLDGIFGLKTAVVVSSYYKNGPDDRANTGTPVGRRRTNDGQNES